MPFSNPLSFSDRHEERPLSVPIDSRRARRRTALALFALLAGIYLISASGHFYAVDEENMFGVTENLVLHQTFALALSTPDQPALYSVYGPGQSVAAVPLYVLGAGLARLFPASAYSWLTRAIVGCLNAFVTAGIAALIYLAAARLGYSRKAAVGTALLYGLATMAWPHSKTFFAEPLTALLLFGSFAAALADRSARPAALAPGDAGRSLAPLLVSGMLAGLAPAVKIQGGLALPFLGLWVVGFGVWGGGRALFARHLRENIRAGVVWSTGVVLPLAVLGFYQWIIYGSPLRSGYGGGLGGVFQHNMWDGAASLLWSTGKGLLWYAPPVLLLPAGLWLLRRRDWRVALLCLLLLAAHLLFYGRVIFWHGDGAWGPRYLNIVLPFAVFPLAALLDAPRGWRGALALTLILAAPVQLAGLTIDFDTYINAERDAEARYHDPARSPIVGQLGFAWEQARLAYEIYLAPERVALIRGFSYSEGDRERGQQTPRWTLPAARIDVRPGAQPAVLTLGLSGCRPAPAGPGRVAVRVDGLALFSAEPCPQRRYLVALPARDAAIEIAADAWEPRALGLDRDGPLGALLYDLSARAGGRPLAVSGAVVPIPPLPAEPHDLYYWTSDRRYGHWDFWWWYLARSGLPAGPSAVLAAAWLACAIGLIAFGLRWGRLVPDVDRADRAQLEPRDAAEAPPH